MSKDSSATYIHMHFPRLADVFEDFCRPPSSQPNPPLTQTPHLSSNHPSTSSSTHPPPNPTNTTTTNPTNNGNNDNMAQLPGHFLPFEEILLPPHLMPVNPEDEDDVVPDMHAAFGINRALGQGQEGTVPGVGGGGGGAGQAREPPWRDFGLEELVRRGPGPAGPGGGEMVGAGVGVGLGRNRKDGKRTGLRMMR